MFKIFIRSILASDSGHVSITTETISFDTLAQAETAYAELLVIHANDIRVLNEQKNSLAIASQVVRLYVEQKAKVPRA
jgi:hypothetical protein